MWWWRMYLPTQLGAIDTSTVFLCLALGERGVDLNEATPGAAP